MTKALQKALEHFSSLKNASIEIPEWGGVEVHYSPLGLAERQRFISGGGGPDEMSFQQAKIIIRHAKNAQGEPLFGEETPDLIRQVQNGIAPVILDRIATAILGAKMESGR